MLNRIVAWLSERGAVGLALAVAAPATVLATFALVSVATVGEVPIVSELYRAQGRLSELGFQVDGGSMGLGTVQDDQVLPSPQRTTETVELRVHTVRIAPQERGKRAWEGHRSAC